MEAEAAQLRPCKGQLRCCTARGSHGSHARRPCRRSTGHRRRWCAPARPDAPVGRGPRALGRPPGRERETRAPLARPDGIQPGTLLEVVEDFLNDGCRIDATTRLRRHRRAAVELAICAVSLAEEIVARLLLLDVGQHHFKPSKGTLPIASASPLRNVGATVSSTQPVSSLYLVLGPPEQHRGAQSHHSALYRPPWIGPAIAASGGAGPKQNRGRTREHRRRSEGLGSGSPCEQGRCNG